MDNTQENISYSAGKNILYFARKYFMYGGKFRPSFYVLYEWIDIKIERVSFSNQLRSPRIAHSDKEINSLPANLLGS